MIFFFRKSNVEAIEDEPVKKKQKNPTYKFGEFKGW